MYSLFDYKDFRDGLDAENICKSFDAIPHESRTDGLEHKIRWKLIRDGDKIRSQRQNNEQTSFVFCEGESEVAYISHLRSNTVRYSDYPKKSDSNISVQIMKLQEQGGLYLQAKMMNNV